MPSAWPYLLFIPWITFFHANTYAQIPSVDLPRTEIELIYQQSYKLAEVKGVSPEEATTLLESGLFLHDSGQMGFYVKDDNSITLICCWGEKEGKIFLDDPSLNIWDISLRTKDEISLGRTVSNGVNLVLHFKK